VTVERLRNLLATMNPAAEVLMWMDVQGSHELRPVGGLHPMGGWDQKNANGASGVVLDPDTTVDRERERQAEADRLRHVMAMQAALPHDPVVDALDDVVLDGPAR
jgi:hypothetical protein